jgi:hypothetical protein
MPTSYKDKNCNQPRFTEVEKFQDSYLYSEQRIPSLMSCVIKVARPGKESIYFIFEAV